MLPAATDTKYWSVCFDFILFASHECSSFMISSSPGGVATLVQCTPQLTTTNNNWTSCECRYISAGRYFRRRCTYMIWLYANNNACHASTTAAAAADTLGLSLCFDSFLTSFPIPVFMRRSAVTFRNFKAWRASRLRALSERALDEATRTKRRSSSAVHTRKFVFMKESFSFLCETSRWNRPGLTTAVSFSPALAAVTSSLTRLM
mmetsp:Transcript_13669/g.59641  ORF Transcript_13669/g.59641 Transcript_13669/m.59641 type:complete len:205 (+) Transcript_13669:2927-3541(+)